MPALLLQQDWALGLVLLKFVHHLIAGIPDGRHGLLGRPLRDTFAHLVAPPLQALAALLAVPYLLTRGLLPLTGLPATALHVCHYGRDLLHMPAAQTFATQKHPGCRVPGLDMFYHFKHDLTLDWVVSCKNGPCHEMAVVLAGQAEPSCW